MTLPSKTNRPTVSDLQRKARLETFSSALRKILERKNMTEADLARLVFGERPTAAGGTEAISRDRINLYVRGIQLPSDEALDKISKALGHDFNNLFAPQVSGDDFEWSEVNVPGRRDRVYLRFSAELPYKVANRFRELIDEIRELAHDSNDLTDA